MKPTPIFDYLGWRVESHSNGAAYTLTAPDGASVFIQYGDDAAAFRSDYDAADALSEGLSVQFKLSMIQEYFIGDAFKGDAQ